MARVVLGALLFLTIARPSAARAQLAAPAPESVAVGDWQLYPLFEARVRGEYRHDLDDRDRGILLERARLGVDVQRGPVEARVVLQDARAWNVSAGTDPVAGPPSFAATGALEAWGEAHTGSVQPSFVRIGRQTVVWGEGRLLGVADWTPAGRALDAIRARLVAGEVSFELLASILSNPASSPGQAYGELFGARAEWRLDPLFVVEAYVLARVAQTNPLPDLEASVRGETVTGSLRLHGDAEGWTWGAEGAYQLGRAADLHRNRAAWAAAGHVARTFDRALLLPRVTLGGSYASGATSSPTYRAFDPLLPDVHAWLGAMDVLAWSNEEEANVKLAIAPWAETTASVAYRYARLVEPGGSWRSAYLATISVAPQNTRSELGHEIDAAVTWSPWSAIELGAGYSLLVVGAGARALLEANAPIYGTGAPPTLSHFGYAQALLRVP